MFIKDGKRFNIYAQATVDAVTYANFLDSTVRAAVGITEIADPPVPEGYDPDLYYRVELDEAPYVIFTPKSAEQVEAVLAKRQQLADDTADLTEIRQIPFVNFLVTKRPAQIANKIQSDLAADGIEAVLVKLAKAIAVLAKDKFR